jgi:hypothetical protein
VVRDAAVETIGAGPEAELAVDSLPGLREGQGVDASPANAAQAQVVRVLALVSELDDRLAGLDRLT